VFSLTGAFSLTGMTAASGDNLDITFTLAKDAQCPTSSDAALLPVIKVLRHYCDGSIIPRGAVNPKALFVTKAVCGDGVFKASITVPRVRADKCFAVYIKVADGQGKLAVIRYA
jgi:hypothetical protein